MSEAARGIPTVEELQREYRLRLAAAARSQYTNDDLVKAWFKAAEPEVEPVTIRTWRNNVKHLLEYAAKHDLHVLDVQERSDVLAYIKWVETAPYTGRRKKGPLSASALRQHIQQGSSFFNYLVERGLASVNPFFTVDRIFKRKRRAELKPELRALDERETLLQLEGAESLDDYLTVLIPFKTGARREEIAGIRMAEINWKDRTIYVDPHPKRSQPLLYFDEELEYFLRLKCERNERDYPGNPYLFPSPIGKGRHLKAQQLAAYMRRIVLNSPLAKTIVDKASNVTMHTGRRSFTSVLKRKRPTAPQGVPSHIVAVLRGDSLLSRNENTPDTTQGYYTKFGEIEGVGEVRWWYDRGMPKVGAREAWERLMPSRKSAVDVRGLIRAAKAGAP